MGLLFKLDALGSLRGLIGTLNYSCDRNLGLAAHNSGLNFYNDNTSCYSVNVSGVETGKWLYGVGTYDGTTTRTYMFKDGNLSKSSGTGKSGATNTFTSKFRVMGPDHSYRTNGQCANAFVYNKTLTEAEILQNYFQGPIVTDGLTFAIDASNLVSYENGSTTVYSLTGSMSGTLTNGPTFNSMNGGVLEFDGTDDHLTFPNTEEFTTTGDFSIDLWFYGGSGVDSYGGLFNKGGSGNFGNWGLYGDGGNNYVRFGYKSTNNSQEECSDPNYTDISTPGWYHYCGTFDGSNLRLYRNGIQIATKTNISTLHQTPLTNNKDVGLGWRPASGQYEVNYKVGAARLYNGKALSPSEVMQNYNASIGKFK